MDFLQAINLLNSGYDQLHTQLDNQQIIDAIQIGLIKAEQLDNIVMRILTLKFTLGQFESPFVNTNTFKRLLTSQAVQQTMSHLQRQSLVLLEYKQKLLPLAKQTRVYLVGIEPQLAIEAGLKVVKQPSE